ncbi:hypothetical protein C1I59_05090 [Paenibacillus polymyxa]|uniref:hypothetical protein n=1 Tax=Paenibacillus polymyxa TaxID=1406 RepID=UPI0010BEAA3B|nr:hypothetical protein [Paenibacillus polymyxa]TKH38653.1 hypothetical protein C1I59_05090 [Paenibacillus polymyxa]
MQELMYVVESNSFHKLLASLFLCSTCFIAVLYLLISIKRNSLDSKAMKFFGVLVISGFALFINNWTIYVLVTIVASTLITVPKFLERILEITFRKQNYTLTTGTTKGRINKNLKEIERTFTTGSGVIIPDQAIDSEFNSSETPLEQQANLIMSIEDKILHAIEFEKETLNFDNIKFNQILKSNKKELVIDAVLTSNKRTIILEVQPILQYELFYKAIGQLKDQCSEFKKYLKGNDNQSEVKGILCILDSPDFTESIVGGIGLLKYDLKQQGFVNLNEVLEWLI